MNKSHSFGSTLPMVAALLVLGALSARADTGNATAPSTPNRPQAVFVAVTNWSLRLLTNVIEVRMPLNQFVDEYRTNWVTRFTTNIMQVYRTNLIRQTRTNEVLFERVQTNVVTAWLTNYVTAYQTNLKSLTLTNWETVPVVKTNLVAAWLTNYATAYQTNLKTLTLTNWETVLVMKTNWVRQPVTNVAEIDIPLSPSAITTASLPSAPAPAAPPQGNVETAAPSAATTQDYVVEVIHPTATVTNNQVEIQMTLKSAQDSGPILPVKEWRVERSDNAVLVFGQRPEFHGQLPPGFYKITVKAQPDGTGPLLIIRAQLEVSLASHSQRIPATATPSRR